MDVRERLIELINEGQKCPGDRDPFGASCEQCPYYSSNRCDIDRLADYLLANGVSITPEIPGPEIADPNIMELCFHNGEQHMKEKCILLLDAFDKDYTLGDPFIEYDAIGKALMDL